MTLRSIGCPTNSSSPASVPSGPLPDTGKPNIFQAFQDQLGLKLESTKAPADVVVIDKAEKPSDN